MQISREADTTWIFRMKGLATLMIVAYHWFDKIKGGIINLFSRFGGQGVHIFVILSAFGLTLGVYKMSRINWEEWYKKRFIKLLVPYYSSLWHRRITIFANSSVLVSKLYTLFVISDIRYLVLFVICLLYIV